MASPFLLHQPQSTSTIAPFNMPQVPKLGSINLLSVPGLSNLNGA